MHPGRCRVCGRPLEYGGKGRRPEYCAPLPGQTKSDCKRLSDLLYEATRLWTRVVQRAGRETVESSDSGLKSVRMLMIHRMRRWARDTGDALNEVAMEEREGRGSRGVSPGRN